MTGMKILEDDPRVKLDTLKRQFDADLNAFVTHALDKTQFVIKCLEHQGRLDGLMSHLCEQYDGISFEEAADLVEAERRAELESRQAQPDTTGKA